MSDGEAVPWMSVAAAARYLGVSVGTIRRWSDAGHLGFIRTPGGQRRFDRGTLDAFLAARSSRALVEGPTVGRPAEGGGLHVDTAREKLLAFYRPNVPRGNFQPDIAKRGANDLLRRILLDLGLMTEAQVEVAFGVLDVAVDDGEAGLERIRASFEEWKAR